VNLRIASVVKYGQGSAPLAGIPIAGVGTIVLLRRHLRAALEIQPVRIIYNQDSKIVTFRNHRAEWRLNDLLGQGKVQQWQIRDQLRSWANGKRSAARKRKETAALGKDGAYVRRLREAVAKLQRQRDKIFLRKPESPLNPQRWHEAGEYSRNQTRAWINEKATRKALARLAGQKLIHGEPQTWAEFYREVERITGKAVSESQKYSRVHARKRYRHGLPNYPNREDYLKALPSYLFMAEKPFDWRPHDLYKKDDYGEQLNPLERRSHARLEYCAALRERNAIESQITAHLDEIVTHGRGDKNIVAGIQNDGLDVQ
jgi:hypothetical protein